MTCFWLRRAGCVRAHDAEAHLQLLTLHLRDIRGQLALISELRRLQMVSNHVDDDNIHRNQVAERKYAEGIRELLDHGSGPWFRCAVAAVETALAQRRTAARPIAAPIANLLLS
eukprot:3210057-Prymnesium_polylepis.2